MPIDARVIPLGGERIDYLAAVHHRGDQISTENSKSSCAGKNVRGIAWAGDGSDWCSIVGVPPPNGAAPMRKPWRKRGLQSAQARFQRFQYNFSTGLRVSVPVCAWHRTSTGASQNGMLQHRPTQGTIRIKRAKGLSLNPCPVCDVKPQPGLGLMCAAPAPSKSQALGAVLSVPLAAQFAPDCILGDFV